VEAVGRREDAWGRLAWQVPLATFLTLVGLMSFLRLLEPSDVPPPAPRPLDVEVAAPPPPPIVAPTPAAPKPPARPTPPPVRERRPAEIRPAVEPPPFLAPVAAPPAVAPPEPLDSARPAMEARDAIAPPAAAPQPAAPSTATTSSTSKQDDGRASRVPHETARDPVAGPRGGPPGGGTAGARVIYQPLPEIPEALRHRSIEIIAVARFKVAANGSAQVELTEPTADPDLNHALLESLRRWRFFPAMQDGKPAASTVEIRIPISVR
jgi:protein TonB